MTQAEYDHLRGLVLRHDAELSKLKGVPEMVGKVVDQVNRVSRLVDELSDWKDDSKVQHINSLQGQVKAMEREKQRAVEEAKRDQLDFRRSLRATVISIISTLVVAYIAAKLGVHVP